MHGAAGAVGSMVTQLAREAGAYVIGTGRAAHRQTALDVGAREFVDLDNDALEDVGESIWSSMSSAATCGASVRGKAIEPLGPPAGGRPLMTGRIARRQRPGGSHPDPIVVLFDVRARSSRPAALAPGAGEGRSRSCTASPQTSASTQKRA